ncbi:MAG: hypothetical protein ACREMJ_05610 [Gemmatimonadales bacterium]
MDCSADRRIGGWLDRRAILALVLVSACPSIRLCAQDTLPVGYGTLRRDDITVRFATGQVEIQVLPLDEGVIRLLAPDTYRSLSQLLDSRRAELDSAATRAGVRHPTLVMVTFFGIIPQARFVPEDVEIMSRGRLFRPAAIVALSPGWASLQLAARQQAVAIYLFEEGISFRESLTVSYQGQQNGAWSRSVSVLERERARVMARARARQNP